MKREDLIKVFTMKIDGYSYQKIGEEFGVTRQYIHNELTRAINLRGYTIKKPRFKCIYPEILKFMKANDLKVEDFAEKVDISDRVIRSRLSGATSFKMKEMKNISELMKQSIERIFYEGMESK